MAKKEQNGSTTAIAEQPATELNVATQNVVSNDEAARALQNATRGEKDSGYLNFEPGKPVRVVYKGTKDIKSLDTTQPEGTMTKAIVFVTDSGKEQISADVAIRSYFERQPIGCAREIVCKGMTKGPKGEYKTFDFFELNMSAK